MALQSPIPLLMLTPSRVVDVGFRSGFVNCAVPCKAAATNMSNDHHHQTITRRSANFKPPIWSYDYIQSLSGEPVGESNAKKVNELKENVRAMLFKVTLDPLHQLELIDTMQRLGISYHFENEIRNILDRIYNKRCNYNVQKSESLYGVALEFRLLRQHGYDISQELLSSFKDEKGNFESCLGDDCRGILSLYEAAYLCVEGESLFLDAINFTTPLLKEYVKQDNKDEYLSILAKHALEIPLHWRMLRLEARWFIDVYETKHPGMNPILLELAKLDFNMVQATHQEDLKHASIWWRNTGFGERLDFARDRLMENFFWTVGEKFEPQFGHWRRIKTKIHALITTIDDVYDIYGTLNELELFTDTIERWDITAMEQLPYYMKLCFLALFNAINEMAFDSLRDDELDIIEYLRKEWAILCKAYLVEARWYYNRHIPTFKEYMDNAWISISAPAMLVHAYFLIRNDSTTKEAVERLKEHSNIIRYASTILRLADDLGTGEDEMNRGDVPKSIHCYMHETGASEEKAREYVRELITETWLKMNKEIMRNPNFSKTFVGIAMNMGRMAQCMYQYGDGHSNEDQETKSRVLSVFINPIR